MKKSILFFVIAVLALSLLYSCTKDKTAAPAAVDCTGVNTATNTYTLNVGPNILDTYCSYAPCHDAHTASQGIDLSSYSSSVNSFKNFNIICAVKGGSCELMPKGGPAIPDSLIKQLQCWQANGYAQ